ncbi:hypothetical protein SDC9_81666 [bioreactor metagenome]|uniref:Uncharacterized protein n=1 Tax=bioreactor metagenome TaxID=1076179 RepID=A0A644Z2J8_9ZZZZ
MPSLRRKTREGQAVTVSLLFHPPEDCPHVLQILGGVHARAALPPGHGHLHGIAMLQDPELLEGFRRRKRRGGQGGVGEEKLPAEAVDADMPVDGNARFNPWIGDDGPAEVQGAAEPVHDHLHHVGIPDGFRVGQRFAEGGREGLSVLRKKGGRLVNHDGVQEGFVSLDVDHHVGVFLFGRFRRPAGAVGVVRGREDAVSTEAPHLLQYTLVVRGDHEAVENRGKGRPFVDPADECLAADVRQGLAGQARGGVPGRDDAEDSHACNPYSLVRARSLSLSTGFTASTIHSLMAFPSGVCWA